ncbi:MAG: heme exporter protein CcmB [Rhodospirillaceae bacterium]|nr:heme exporter protein CcmB [Rhodospirillaceae bacterium]
MSGARSWVRLVRRDVRLGLSAGSDAAAALVFFVIATALFPLGLGPEANLLARIAGGVLWVAALLANLLSMERLFAGDFEDGTLDLLALGTLPLELVALAKVTAHWLITGLPLMVVAPLMGALLNLPGEAFGVLAASLALGTPSLSLLGGVGAALVLGTRRGGVLLALLILPIFVPLLVFGAAAVDAAVMGLTVRPHLLLLGGLFALALTLGPIAGAAALRQAVR